MKIRWEEQVTLYFLPPGGSPCLLSETTLHLKLGLNYFFSNQREAGRTVAWKNTFVMSADALNVLERSLDLPPQWQRDHWNILVFHSEKEMFLVVDVRKWVTWASPWASGKYQGEGQKKQRSPGGRLWGGCRGCRFGCPIPRKAIASQLLPGVIFGPPSSGEDTVCWRITQNFGLQYPPLVGKR